MDLGYHTRVPTMRDWNWLAIISPRIRRLKTMDPINPKLLPLFHAARKLARTRTMMEALRRFIEVNKESAEQPQGPLPGETTEATARTVGKQLFFDFGEPSQAEPTQ